MNVLDRDTQKMVLKMLVEGTSLRSVSRVTGVARNTISELLKNVGAHCKNHHDRFVTNVSAQRVQADEVWSYTQKKQKNVKNEEVGTGVGDCWTWVAVDQDSRLIVAYRVGDRSGLMAHAFMHDLHDRLNPQVRTQLSTDALAWYLGAVESAFGWRGCDFGQVLKTYGSPHDQSGSPTARRYSPQEVSGIQKFSIMGDPKESDICTSHVERTHLTLRQQQKRMSRLTIAFSKKREFHLYATALHTTWYNYVRTHATLSKQNGQPVTPAMAAGLALHPWSFDDLLDLLHGN
jgi:IS1 family transposase